MKRDRVRTGQIRRIMGGLLIFVCICGWGAGVFPLAEPIQTGDNSISGSPLNFTILAINDFQGHITSGMRVNNVSVGGMDVLASYLRQAINVSGDNRTVIALPGDITGVSPPESGLLLDEPTLLFFNLFSGNTSGNRTYHPIASCAVIATVGNHEFDRDINELFRKIYGGNGTTTIPHLQDPYPGSDAAFIASNIVVRDTGKLLLPPYVIRNVGDVPVAYVGAVSTSTPSIVLPDNVKDLVFLDEADAINQQVEILKAQGIHAFVALIHEGGEQTPYEGQTRPDSQVTGRIVDIVSRLDSDVDVVLSGHTLQFTNAYLPNSGGRPVLVTQAYSYGRAFANVSLAVDPVSNDITWKTASIVVPYVDIPPGTNPNPEASRLLNDTLTLTGPLIKEIISSTQMNISVGRNTEGESNLYDLVTDSMRRAMQSDIAIINEGAVRADIGPGNITEGKMYEMLPFGNNIITVTLTGGQILSLLEQQWNRTVVPHHMLQISGFTYTYDDSKPEGSRVVSTSLNGSPLDPGQRYTIATVAFLSGGGDGYTVMKQGLPGETGPLDIDALTSYIRSLPVPLVINPDGRIKRVSSPELNVTGS